MQNNVYCFTITNTEVSSASKQTIVLTARTHPGETVSSHIMQGFLDALLNSSVESQLLRRKFIFRVIPMINPDGVVLGNYRLSYSGHDLNRKWKETSARLHP
jgi:murein tripeptide amidase MpaA